MIKATNYNIMSAQYPEQKDDERETLWARGVAAKYVDSETNITYFKVSHTSPLHFRTTWSSLNHLVGCHIFVGGLDRRSFDDWSI